MKHHIPEPEITSDKLSALLSSASEVLQSRIETGEYDALDEAQRYDLELLSRCLAKWSSMAEFLEQGLGSPQPIVEKDNLSALRVEDTFRN